MKIYFEIFVLIISIIILLILKLVMAFTKRRSLKKYKPEDDKSRRGGEYHKPGRREQEVKTTSESVDGLEQPEGRELLQTTTIDNNRETNSNSKCSSNGNRKNGSRFKRLLKRRRIK